MSDDDDDNNNNNDNDANCANFDCISDIIIMYV